MSSVVVETGNATGVSVCRGMSKLVWDHTADDTTSDLANRLNIV